MTAVISQLSIDAADPSLRPRGGARCSAGPSHQDETFPDEVWIEPSDAAPGAVGILFLKVPEGKTVKNRLHLDVRPADGTTQEAELARLLALGAHQVDIGQGDVPWQVLADPEGNEFCLLWRTPSEARGTRGRPGLRPS